MRHLLTPRNLQVGGLIGCCLLASGCATLRGKESQLDHAQQQVEPAPRKSYASAAITYRLGPSYGQPAVVAGAAPTRSAPGDVQLASYQTPDAHVKAAAQSAVNAKTQTLAIKYPHPEGRKGFALAEVVVASAQPAAPANEKGILSSINRIARDNLPGIAYAPGIEGAYALDIPIDEVDALIHKLDKQGFFGDAASLEPQSDLAARINGLGFHKHWQNVPELNDLISRVRREGQLVSHREPLVQAESTEPDPAATGALYIPPSQSALIIERLPPVL